MKKLIFFTLLSALTLACFSQLQEQSDTLVVPVGVDSVFTYHGYAQAQVFIEVDFTTADAFDGTLGIGGSYTAYDTLYGEYPSMHNPVNLDLTNFTDTICRIERTVGLSAPFLKIRLTKGTATAGLKYPIKITFDRF